MSSENINSIPKFIPPEIIGERMKERELKTAQSVWKVEPWQYAILRFDGHNFSKFTNGFKKPFDNKMKNAMQDTTKAVMGKFNATLGYVQSDEITLVFKPKYNSKEEFEASLDKSEHIFGGKRDKLISVITGYISTKFNYYINKYMQWCNPLEYKPYFTDIVMACEQHFDGRLIVFEPSEMTEMLNYFVWRQNDCLRNCTSTWTRFKCGKTAVHKKKFAEMVEMLDATDMKHDMIPFQYKYGVFAKKELYEKECNNPETGKTVLAMRSKIVIKPVIVSANENFEFLIKDKYWDYNKIE